MPDTDNSWDSDLDDILKSEGDLNQDKQIDPVSSKANNVLDSKPFTTTALTETKTASTDNDIGASLSFAPRTSLSFAPSVSKSPPNAGLGMSFAPKNTVVVPRPTGVTLDGSSTSAKLGTNTTTKVENKGNAPESSENDDDDDILDILGDSPVRQPVKIAATAPRRTMDNVKQVEPNFLSSLSSIVFRNTPINSSKPVTTIASVKENLTPTKNQNDDLPDFLKDTASAANGENKGQRRRRLVDVIAEKITDASPQANVVISKSQTTEIQDPLAFLQTRNTPTTGLETIVTTRRGSAITSTAGVVTTKVDDKPAWSLNLGHHAEASKAIKDPLSFILNKTPNPIPTQGNKSNSSTELKLNVDQETPASIQQTKAAVRKSSVVSNSGILPFLHTQSSANTSTTIMSDKVKATLVNTHEPTKTHSSNANVMEVPRLVEHVQQVENISIFQQQFDLKVEQMKLEHERTLASLKDEHRQQLADETTRLNTVRNDDIARLKKEHKDEMSKMMSNAESTKKLSELVDKLNQSEANVSELQSQLSSRHARNIDDREAAVLIREQRADERQNEVAIGMKGVEEERKRVTEAMKLVDSNLAELRKQETEVRAFTEAEKGRLAKEQDRLDAERRYLMDALEREKLTFVTMRETFEAQRLETLKSFEVERRVLATEKIKVDRIKEEMLRLSEASMQQKLEEERSADDLRALLKRQTSEMREKQQEVVRVEMKSRLNQQRMDMERLRIEAERSLMDEKKQELQRMFDDSRKLFEAAALERRKIETLNADLIGFKNRSTSLQDQMNDERQQLATEQRSMQEQKVTLARERQQLQNAKRTRHTELHNTDDAQLELLKELLINAGSIKMQLNGAVEAGSWQPRVSYVPLSQRTKYPLRAAFTTSHR